MRFTAPYSDEAIVAWLDGEMQASDAERFEVALGQDEQLAARTEMLRLNQTDIASAFAPLLNEAPHSRLEAQLANVLAQPPETTVRATGRQPTCADRRLTQFSGNRLRVGLSGTPGNAGAGGERKNS